MFIQTCKFALVSFSLAILGAAQANAQSFLSERQTLAMDEQHQLVADRVADGQHAMALVEGMGIPSEYVIEARLEGATAQAAALPLLGRIEPLRGEYFSVLSTGIAGNPARPGTQVTAADGQENTTRLVVRLQPPAGYRRFSFQYRFMSAEYPEFSGSGYADEFTVHLTDSDGRRQVARMAANSPRLSPVSTRRAAGTGFNLYTERQGAMQGALDFGMPAAGMADWQWVEIPVAGDGPVELEFTIRDQGDGLVDSTVILDNFSLPSIQMTSVPRTAARGFGSGSSPLAQALECLGHTGEVVGAVADGETAVEVTVSGLPGPGQMTYTINGQVPADGGFDEPGGDQRLEEYTVTLEEVEDGVWGAVAQYLVPEDFNRGGDEQQAMRNVELQVAYQPDNPGDLPGTGSLDLQLWRPPLVLMHGLWSNQETWLESPLMSDSRVNLFLGNYEDTNASHFHINTEEPARPILSACRSFLKDTGNPVAMNQVDYAGHSMGAILARNFESEAPGLINKLISLNTPHTGSPLANSLVHIRESVPVWYRIPLDLLLETIGFAWHRGAIDDLAIGSGAINQIPATQMPSHAMVGTGGSDVFEPPLSLLIQILRDRDLIGDDVQWFPPGCEHDLVVERSSQEGGLSGGATSVFGGINSIHTRVPGNPSYASGVIDLLNASVESGSFGEFPAPSTLSFAPDFNIRSGAVVRGDAIENGVEIVSPSPDTVFAPGDEIPLAVESRNGFPLAEAAVYSKLGNVDLPGPQFTGMLVVPSDAGFGPVELIAFGEDLDGTPTTSEPVTIVIKPDLELTDMEIVDSHVTLANLDERHQLLVRGTFSDDSVGDITHSSAGTVYQSADPNVVTVSADGELIPQGVGETVVIAQNNGLQSDVTVEVLSDDGNGGDDMIFEDKFE